MMTDPNSISVIIPALNEEKNIESLVKVVCESVEKNFNAYEIIIFNDGSTDQTGDMADRLAFQNDKIKVVHNKKPQCIGGVYKEGLKMATMNYLIHIHGKNDTTCESLDRIFALKGKYDMVVPYTLNLNARSAIRIFFSNTFGWLLNTMFGLNVKYYNHYVLHKSEIVNSIKIHTNSYAFQAEVLIKLIKKGYSYVEVGVMDVFEKDVKTKAFRIKNVLEVMSFFMRMNYEYYFGHTMRMNSELSSTD